MIDMNTLRRHIESELAVAQQFEAQGELISAFRHLERAHVLGQAITFEHTRIHWQMFKLALKMKSLREIFGQMIRIVGAATKTPFGIYPAGNTGGANVWFFKRMPVPGDLQQIIDKARMN
jgi:hypothetical protein